MIVINVIIATTVTCDCETVCDLVSEGSSLTAAMEIISVINCIYSAGLAAFFYYFSAQDIAVFLFFTIFGYHFFQNTGIVDRNVALAERFEHIFLEIKNRVGIRQVNREASQTVKLLNEKVSLLEREVIEIKEKLEKLTTHFIEINNNKTETECLLKNEIEVLKTEGKDNRTQLKDLEESAKVMKADCVNSAYNYPETLNTAPQEARSSLPVGSILPWLNRIKKPSGVFTLSPDLPPPGWVFCDGQVIESGQWLGLETPHINAEKGLFLRGGPHYLCGKQETEMLENHGHQVHTFLWARVGKVRT